MYFYESLHAHMPRFSITPIELVFRWNFVQISE